MKLSNIIKLPFQVVYYSFSIFTLGLLLVIMYMLGIFGGDEE